MTSPSPSYTATSNLLPVSTLYTNNTPPHLPSPTSSTPYYTRSGTSCTPPPDPSTYYSTHHYLQSSNCNTHPLCWRSNSTRHRDLRDRDADGLGMEIGGASWRLRRDRWVRRAGVRPWRGVKTW